MISPFDPFRRRQVWKHRGFFKGAHVLCYCGCGRPVGEGRETTHSPECYPRWREYNDFSLIRKKVFARDKGVCAICNADTTALQAAYQAQLRGKWAEKFKGWGAVPETSLGKIRYMLSVAKKPHVPLPPKGFPASERSWWEADHVIPVVEGGGGCDFTGYRTLCIPCHKAETAKLAARLAARRKALKDAETPTLQLT